MKAYSDGYWQSADGLRLHYRDYPGRAATGDAKGGQRPPVVCLPGLTRNARDFENLAQRLAGHWRVLCPEMRGRSESDYATDGSSYNPLQYVADVNALLDQAGITRYVLVGTSLGGLMTMLLAMAANSTATDKIAGALLNDIGPVLESSGLVRIGGYVGQGQIFADWGEAADALAKTQAIAYPDYRADDWLAMARRVMRRGNDGRIAFDYDTKIAESFGQASARPIDLWPGIDALARCPVLLVRGGLSDLLSADIFAQMRLRLPDAEAVTLPRIGHTPTLDEPEVTAAIDRWLAQVA